VRRLLAKAPVDALLIADGARIALQAAPAAGGHACSAPNCGRAMPGSRAAPPRGAWFATVSDARFGQFEQSYRRRYGASPSRIATLGYDSVLLTLNVGRTWKPGTIFPTAKLYDRDGFIGLDGVFRFNQFGVAERAMEVREVGAAPLRR
jgi:hypothetical protein